MKKIVLSIIMLLFLLGIVLIPQRIAYSDELEEIAKKINELQQALEMSKKATAPLETQLKNLKQQLVDIETRVLAIEIDVKSKRKFIDQGYKQLVTQKEIFNKTVRDYYIKTHLFSPLLSFFAGSHAQDVTKLIAYRKKSTEQDKALITTIAIKIVDLEEKKKKLETEEQRLSSVKEQLAGEKKEVEGVVIGAKEYQQKLAGEIAELSARQQAILTARSGTFTTSVGDVPLTDDPASRPDFDPGFRPAFAAFSFGAYTHRKGMSQYGAKGRADSGQNYREVLRAYFGKEPVDKDTNGSISVTGFGNLDFENYYLLGIAEMPSSWNKEALKAQAVAARSYAYRYKIQGNAICTTEACQVFSNSKAANPPGEWRQAVEETRGQVVEDVVTFYSSTTGGYITTMGWDTTDGQGGPGFATRAWESKAGSPWFYKGWYTEGYFNNSAKCGRSNPWLTLEEFADMLNAWVVRQKGGGDDVKRILPTTIKSCSIGGSGSEEPYSITEMKDRANALGGAYTSISNVSVEYSNSGSTATVKLQTNLGELSLSGSDFKTIFNLRAPGYISIRNTLFNIEKK